MTVRMRLSRRTPNWGATLPNCRRAATTFVSTLERWCSAAWLERACFLLPAQNGAVMKNTQPQQTTSHSTCAGFTIAEVLVAVGVGSVLLALAAPQLPAYKAEFQIANSAREIATDLQRARMKAVAENAFYRIVFNTDGTYVRQSSADGATFVNDDVPVALPSGIRFVVTFGGLPQPKFNRLGTLAADARLTLTNSIGQTKVVQMNTLGQVTIS